MLKHGNIKVVCFENVASLMKRIVFYTKLLMIVLLCSFHLTIHFVMRHSIHPSYVFLEGADRANYILKYDLDP